MGEAQPRRSFCLIFGSFWLRKSKEEQTSKRDNFCQSFKSWGTHFSNSLTFPIRFKPSKTAWDLTPSSSTIPHTVCDESVSTKSSQSPQILALNYYSSTTPGFIFEAKISGTKFCKPTSISAIIFRAVSAALWFNLNS